MGKKKGEGLVPSPPIQPSVSDANAIESNNSEYNDNDDINNVNDTIPETYKDMYYNGDEVKEDMDMSALCGEEIIDGETIVPGYNQHRTEMATASEKPKNQLKSKDAQTSVLKKDGIVGETKRTENVQARKINDLSHVRDEENSPPSTNEKSGPNVLPRQESMFGSHASKQYRGTDNRKRKSSPCSENFSISIDEVRGISSDVIEGTLPSCDDSISVNIQTPGDILPSKKRAPKQYCGNDNRKQKKLPYKLDGENLYEVQDVLSKGISGTPFSRDHSKSLRIQPLMNDLTLSKNQTSINCDNDNGGQDSLSNSKRSREDIDEVRDVPFKATSDTPLARNYTTSHNIQTSMDTPPPSKNKIPKQYCGDDKNSLPSSKSPGENLDEARDVPSKTISDASPTSDNSKSVHIQTLTDAPPSFENQVQDNQAEVIILDGQNEGVAKASSKTREEKILSGELEEGEITDDDEDDSQPVEKEPRRLCKFFKRGQCTWGDRCKFLHPGVTNKGNYSMFGTRPNDATGEKKPTASSANSSEKTSTRKELPFMKVGDVPFEIAWKRGLEKAREDLRRAAESGDQKVLDSLRPPVIEKIKIGVLELPVRRRRKTIATIVIDSSPEPELVPIKQEREDNVKPDVQARDENIPKSDVESQEKIQTSEENHPMHYITLPDTKFPPPPLPNLSIPPPPIISIPPPPLPRMDLWPGLTHLPPNHFDLMRMRALPPPGPFPTSQFYFPPPTPYFLPPPPIRPANQQNINVPPPHLYPHSQNNRNVPTMYGQRDQKYDQKQSKREEKDNRKKDERANHKRDEKDGRKKHEKGRIHSDKDSKHSSTSSRHRHHDYIHHRSDDKRESRKRKSRSTTPSYPQEKKRKADAWDDPWMRLRSSEVNRKKRKRSSSSSNSNNSSKEGSSSQAKSHAKLRSNTDTKLRATKDAKMRANVISTSHENMAVASRNISTFADARSRTRTDSKLHASTSAKSHANADSKSSAHKDSRSHASTSSKSHSRVDDKLHTRVDARLRAVAHSKSQTSVDARTSKKKSPIKFEIPARSHLVVPRAIVNVLDLHAAPNRISRMNLPPPVPEPINSSSKAPNKLSTANESDKSKVSAPANARKSGPRARESPMARKSSSSSDSSSSRGSGNSSSSSSDDSSSHSSSSGSDSSSSSDSDQQPKRRRKQADPQGDLKKRKSPQTLKSKERERESSLEESSSSDDSSDEGKRCKPRASSPSTDEEKRNEPHEERAESSSSDDASDEANPQEQEEEHAERSSVEDFIDGLMQLSPRSDDRCVKLAEKLKIIEDAIKKKQEEAERKGRPF